MSDAQDSTRMDDIPAVEGQSEQDLLDAVMRNSPIMDELDLPLPAEEEKFDDTAESETEDPEVPEPVDSEDEEEVDTAEDEVDEDDGAEEAPTGDIDVYTAEDLDLDAKVAVKVDGEEMEVSFADLLKGYQTDAHLSKKGRELGEAQKEFEEERTAKLSELDNVASASSQLLTNAENNLSKQYHDLATKIDKARANGDSFEVNELKDKRDQVQERYWKTRNQREALVKQVSEAKQEAEQKVFEEQLASFQETIPSMIPDFDDKVAMEIRDFAIQEGIAEGLLNAVVDPGVVKFIDDYRRLKQGVTKGSAKRKAAPAKKALPTKKAPSTKKKAETKAKTVRAKALSENSSQDDQMEFLRQYASKSLNL